MIYDFILPGELTVSIVEIPPNPRNPGGDVYRLKYGSNREHDYLLTILLHISQESRTHAFRRFKPFLASPWVNMPLYFDFLGDTLVVDSSEQWKFMTARDVEGSVGMQSSSEEEDDEDESSDEDVSDYQFDISEHAARNTQQYHEIVDE